MNKILKLVIGGSLTTLLIICGLGFYYTKMIDKNESKVKLTKEQLLVMEEEEEESDAERIDSEQIDNGQLAESEMENMTSGEFSSQEESNEIDALFAESAIDEVDSNILPVENGEEIITDTGIFKGVETLAENSNSVDFDALFSESNDEIDMGTPDTEVSNEVISTPSEEVVVDSGIPEPQKPIVESSAPKKEIVTDNTGIEHKSLLWLAILAFIGLISLKLIKRKRTSISSFILAMVAATVFSPMTHQVLATDINIKLTPDVESGSTVKVGDTITFTVELENKTKEDLDVRIYEENGLLNAETEITIPALESAELAPIVKISNSRVNNGKIYFDFIIEANGTEYKTSRIEYNCEIIMMLDLDVELITNDYVDTNTITADITLTNSGNSPLTKLQVKGGGVTYEFGNLAIGDSRTENMSIHNPKVIEDSIEFTVHDSRGNMLTSVIKSVDLGISDSDVLDGYVDDIFSIKDSINEEEGNNGIELTSVCSNNILYITAVNHTGNTINNLIIKSEKHQNEQRTISSLTPGIPVTVEFPITSAMAVNNKNTITITAEDGSITPYSKIVTIIYGTPDLIGTTTRNTTSTTTTGTSSLASEEEGSTADGIYLDQTGKWFGTFTFGLLTVLVATKLYISKFKKSKVKN